MNLDFYDVMKKGFCFSSAVSLIFFPIIQIMLIYIVMMKYYLLLIMLYKKRSVWVIKISCICTGYKLVYIIVEALNLRYQFGDF